MRLHEVWLRYGRPGLIGSGPWILRGVSGAVEPGTGVVVHGRNAAGKSTLLRLAAGLLRAGRGTVTGRPDRIGFVPERFPADQPLTSRRYLEAMARIRRADPAGIAAWAERLYFTRLLDTPLPELSKGSAQKVGLIQALLDPPDLLILDEPWEGLDAQTRAEVPLIVAEILASGGRVMISDHLGQTAELPGLWRWHLSDGVVTEDDGDGGAGAVECVVEVAVVAADVPAAVASLRAAGHRVVRVRAS